MLPRILASLSLVLAIVSVTDSRLLNRATANQANKWCPKSWPMNCQCTDTPNFCCPREKYSPFYYTCQPLTDSTCVDQDALGRQLQIICQGNWHQTMPGGPNCLFGCAQYAPATAFTCDSYLQNTCAAE